MSEKKPPKSGRRPGEGKHDPPNDWIAELRRLSGEARAVSGSYATQRGSFLHCVTLTVRLEATKEPGVFVFDCYERSDKGDPHVGRLSEEQVIAWIWERIVTEGRAYADDNNVQRMRGQIEVVNGEGVTISDVPAHALPDGLVAEPLLSSDDEETASLKRIKRELVDMRQQNRLLRTALDDATKNKAQELQEFTDTKRSMSSALNRMTEDVLDHFDRRREDLAKAQWNKQKEVMFNHFMAEVAPKLPAVMDAIIVGVRTFGGRQADPLAVQRIPSEFQLWMVEVFGAAEFAKVSGHLIKVDTLSPNHPDYRGLWLHILAELESGLVQVERNDVPYPERVSRQCRAWANSAVKALKCSPLDFPRLCKLRGNTTGPDPEDPEAQPAADDSPSEEPQEAEVVQEDDPDAERSK